jgi:cysteine synthase
MKKNKINTIIRDFSQAVFAGQTSKEDYINPENHHITPLIEIIDETLNPFAKNGVRIFAKDLRLSPLGQVKSGTVHEMYFDSKKKKGFNTSKTLYEATSGNTGAALSIFIDKQTILYVNDSTPEKKIRILQLFGANVVTANNGIELARRNGAKKDGINLDQYDNKSNPNFFERVIGPQIWNQTNGTITLFCTGLGTTGTMIGISNYLKTQSTKIKTVGVIVKEGDNVPGVRTKKRLEEVSLPWEQTVDQTQIVNAHDSYQKSLDLIRKTMIIAGPSSGFALQGLLQELTVMKNNNKLDDIRNENEEIIAVFPILDGPWLYIDDYFNYLDKKLFKKVQKEN